MRFIGNAFGVRTLSVLILVLMVSPLSAQSEEGSSDLDQAFELKIKARSTKDLDSVVKLCESAIQKGLDKEGTVQAKQLAAACLFEHAEQLTQRIDPRNGRNRDGRWRILRTQALSRLRKATKYEPELIDAYLMMTRLNTLPGGDRDDAIKSIDQAIDLADTNRQQKSQALFLRATLREKEAEQLEDLDEAIEVNPKNIDAVRVRALYHLRRRDPQKAIDDLQVWLGSEKTNAKKHVAVVRELMMMGENFDENIQDEAMDIINKAIEIDSEDPEPLCVRAQLKTIKEDIEDAIDDTSLALKVDPRNLQALMIRASLYSGEEKLDEAMDDVTEALKIRTTEGGLRLRGIIQIQKGEFKKAIQDFQILALEDPSDQFYQRQLGMLYNADDEPTKAIRIFNRLLKENADQSWEGQPAPQQLTLMRRRMSALRGRGDARLSKAQHEGAIKDYEQVLELADLIRSAETEQGLETSEADDGVLNNLAWVLATTPEDDLRDGERAIELATKAAEMSNFEKPHILSTLASGYAETGDFDKAIEWIDKAIEVNQSKAEKSTDKTETDEQQESLEDELESYKQKKPWRESQDVEKEKEAKAKKAKAKQDDAKEDDDSADKKEGKDEEEGDKEDKDNDDEKENDGGEDNDAKEDDDEKEENEKESSGSGSEK